MTQTSLRQWWSATLTILIVAAVLFALGCVLALGYDAATDAIRQDRQIRTFVAVPGVVESSEVYQGKRARKRVTISYFAHVAYRYEFEGWHYRTNRLHPWDENFVTSRPGRSPRNEARAAESDAGRFVAAHPPGKAITVYINPRRPTEAFLVREYSAQPYIPLLLAIGLSSFLPFLFRRTRASVGRIAFELRPGADTRGEPLFPTSLLVSRFRTSVAAALIWHAATPLACGHWYWGAASIGHGTGSPLVAALVWTLLGVPLIILAGYYWLLLHSVSDAQIHVSPWPATLDSTLHVHVRQTARLPLTILAARLEVRAERQRSTKRDVETLVLLRRKADLCRTRRVKARETLVFERTFEIPPDQTPTRYTEEEWIRWFIGLTVEIDGRPDYAADFPLEVVASPDLVADGRRDKPPDGRLLRPESPSGTARIRKRARKRRRRS